MNRMSQEHAAAAAAAAAAAVAATAGAEAVLVAKEREMKEQGSKAVKEVAEVLHEQVT